MLSTTARWWIEHTVGTEDRLAWMHRTSPTDCGVDPSDTAAFFGEVPADNPSEPYVNQAGTLITVFPAPGAGTYVYHLNFLMRSGESPMDSVVEALTTAVFYPS